MPEYTSALPDLLRQYYDVPLLRGWVGQAEQRPKFAKKGQLARWRRVLATLEGVSIDEREQGAKSNETVNSQTNTKQMEVEMSIRIKQTHYVPLPVGEYQATIADILEETGQYGPQLKFVFDITEPEQHSARTLFGWCSQTFSTKSKLYTWTKAALGGGALASDFDFDSDAIIGKSVTLALVVKEGDKGQYNKIYAVRAARRPVTPPSNVFAEPGASIPY